MELALYRKHRPSSFADVVGQDDIVNILMRSVKDKKFAHAYLFSGGRGTGKTSVARIFAAALGCKPTDLYEIDGASNRKIEDVRELREAVHTMPFDSTYKVYIIDEVHMLTKEAWNALLKTLEEPPEHVIFILATTDKDKVPDTIISRCQTFTFKSPTLVTLTDFVERVSKSEGVTLPRAASEMVALSGDGSYRDALSILEKVLVTGRDSKLDADTVARIVGAPTHDLVHRVLVAIDAKAPGDALRAVREAVAANVSMSVYHNMIIEQIRAVLLLRYDTTMAGEIRAIYGEDTLRALASFAESRERHINSHVLLAFLDATPYLGHSANPALPVELAVIRAVGDAR
jgi:DNA polymerase III subunit gamma/tau